jgi:hypothetical protein
MVTTVIAIYGAVVATVSTLLGVWYFVRSGPSLQAEATAQRVAIGEETDSDWDNWDNVDHILLEIWNAGRTEITVDMMCLVINLGNEHIILAFDDRYCMGVCIHDPAFFPDLTGPELPIRISGHSGERWLIRGIDPRRAVHKPWATATLSVMLRVGGRRFVDVPVLDGSYYRKRRYILKPASSLKIEITQELLDEAERKRWSGGELMATAIQRQTGMSNVEVEVPANPDAVNAALRDGYIGRPRE